MYLKRDFHYGDRGRIIVNKGKTGALVEYKQQLDDVLLTLIRNWQLWDTDLVNALHQVTEVIGETLKNERTSVWTLGDGDQENVLNCIDLYDRRQNMHTSGPVLDGANYPTYIDALRHGRVIDAHNALTDPRTLEFTDGYLIPQGIGAMLDATLRKSGHTSGVVCIEHVGGPRLWHDEEQRFVVAIADLISQLTIHYQLRANETKYRTLFDSAGDAIFIMDGDRFIDCNEKTLEMFDCSREQILNQPPYRFSPAFQPDGRDSTEKALEKIHYAMSGERQSFEWEHTKYDGQTFDAEVTLSRVLLNSKVMLLAIVRDISERKNAEREAAKQANLLETSIEAMPGIFYMYNTRGQVVLSNRVFQDMFSDPQRELYITHSIIDEDKEKVEQAFQFILKTGQASTLEFGVKTRQGEQVQLLASGARFELDGDFYVVGAAVNISDRVAAEQKLALSQQELLERNQNLQLINMISRELHGSHDTGSIINVTVEILSRIQGQPIIAILSHNPASGLLHTMASKGLADDDATSRLFAPFSETIARRIFNEQTLKIFSDESGNPADSELGKYMYKLGIKTQICIPLFDKEQPLACILLMYRNTHEFNQLELETLEAIGKILSSALVNARHVNELAFQATHDVLTALPNRSYIRDKMQQMMADANGNQHKIALCLIDLNRFKEVNDTLGHEIGDRVIVKLSNRLRDELKPFNGFVGRLGGDEFAVLLPRITDRSIIDDAIDSIITALERKIELDSIELELGASIGISIFPDHSSDPYELLRSADVAMYRAKTRGISSMLYDPAFDEHTPKRLALITDLRSAVRDDSLFFHFQPKVDLSTNTVVSLEALLRWDHPQYGMVPPDEFIALAEMSDVIQPLTLMVVEKAIVTLKQCQKQKLECAVAVNVSVRNLLDHGFVDKIGMLIEQYDVDPKMLEIEITESALMIDTTHSLRTINRLSEMGLSLYIDDFGTGYSSLAYLKQLPIDALKIDRAFIKDMKSSEHDETIVRSMINLAHNLGLKVVAEGVEDEDTLEMLRKLGCNEVQGYLISQPMPLEELKASLTGSPYRLFV